MLETASIASGATLALFLGLIFCLVLYVRWHQKQKLERLERESEEGVDTVDSDLRTVKSERTEKRPFGAHHDHTIPMSEALKR